MTTVGFVGVGFMGASLARAVRRGSPDVRIGIVEKDSARRETVAQELDAEDYTDQPVELLKAADVVFLAIKPQDLNVFSLAVKSQPVTATVISVLAGTTRTRVSAALGTPEVVRIMPNLAADIGQAVIGVSFPDEITEERRDLIRALLEPAGTLLEVPESLMPVITGISGSGIAFAVEFIDAMAMGAVAQGLPYRQALRAAIDVVSSAAAVLSQQQLHPQEMVSRVCSPAGTTVAGIKALRDRGFPSAVMEAVAAASERSRDLEA